MPFTANFFHFLILGSCSTVLCVGCGESEDATYTTPPNSSATDGTKPNQGFAPPVITVDLTKFATDFGASFQVQADSLEMMATGKTLNAQQSTAYFEAQNNTAKIAVQLSDLLQKIHVGNEPQPKHLRRMQKRNHCSFSRGEDFQEGERLSFCRIDDRQMPSRDQ